MLKVYFGELKDSIYTTSVYFNNTYDEEWFNDELVKQMVKDVDKSDVLSPECIESPVLGQIPPTKLSGGVKTLILILKDDDNIFNASQCGDNCAKWILEIAKIKDITINLKHIMSFKDLEFSAYIINTGETVTSMDRFIDIGHAILVAEEEEH